MYNHSWGGGGRRRSNPNTPAHTGEKCTFHHTDTLSPQCTDQTRVLQRGVCVHGTKVGPPSLSAPFFLFFFFKAGYCEDFLKTLYEERVLTIFWACSGKVCVCACLAESDSDPWFL